MATPEFEEPKPSPIDRFSPSLVNTLFDCQLRAGFQRDTAYSGWRRPTVYGLLGETAHAVAEDASTRPDWPEDESQIRSHLEATWDREVALRVERLGKAWEPATPPHASEWPGYQLTRARTVRHLVRQVLARRKVPRSQEAERRLTVEQEVLDVESGLFGRIDRIERSPTGTRIVDIKTGLRQAEISESQRRQLLLYAFLVQRKEGIWPSELAIEDASGKRVFVTYSPAEADDAVEEAKSRVLQFNENNAKG